MNVTPLLEKRRGLSGLPFANGDVLSGVYSAPDLSLAVGPSNADLVYALGLAQSEMNAHIIMGKIASSTAHLANLRSTCGFDLDTGSESITIAGAADQTKADPRFAIAPVIPIQTRPGIDVDHKDIDISVVVVIAECSAP